MNELIEKTKLFVKKELLGETTGHDYWHSLQVWKNAKNIAKDNKNIDMEIVELSSLLHDIGDWKLNKWKTNKQKTKLFLKKQNLPAEKINAILEIIDNLAYRGSKAKKKPLSKEGKIVQDADRLEALGAIGIARSFATGQRLGQEIYNPNIKPLINMNEEEYKKQYTGKRKNTTINHFYEKLLIVADQMNTKKGKELAKKRKEFIELYLDQFFREWDGKR